MLCDELDVADCDPEAANDPLDDAVEVELALDDDEAPLDCLVDDVVGPVVAVRLAARHPPSPRKPVTLSAVTTRRARHAGDRRRAPVAPEARSFLVRGDSMPRACARRLWVGCGTAETARRTGRLGAVAQNQSVRRFVSTRRQTLGHRLRSSAWRARSNPASSPATNATSERAVSFATSASQARATTMS